MKCFAEMCHLWTGQGCYCAFFGVEPVVEREAWDCGSGRCDPNTGCPECGDEDRTSWVRRS